ncbi:hypothetical protein WJX81_000465 [Elliptochloris bilobata]|uniref:Endoplasmic reticulum transmembrane protein n=1 Tax=Elliptochloris bilobata TaxID=381761 RepID=A0AAW1RC55_9CHLO
MPADLDKTETLVSVLKIYCFCSVGLLLRYIACFLAGALVTSMLLWPRQRQAHQALGSCPAPPLPALAEPVSVLRQRLAELEAQLAEAGQERRLEGVGQGCERCWAALDAERAHEWLLRVRLAVCAAAACALASAAAAVYRRVKQRQVTDLRLELVKLVSALREAQGLTRRGPPRPGAMHPPTRA